MSSVNGDTVFYVRERLSNLLADEFAASGFHNSAAGCTLSRLRDDSLRDCIWLLVDHRVDMDQISCTVNLGICCDEAPMSQIRDQSDCHCTLTWNIGYLMPDKTWHEWEVSELESLWSVAHDLVNQVQVVGLPWLSRFRTGDDVYAELRRSQPRGFVDLKRTASRRAQFAT